MAFNSNRNNSNRINTSTRMIQLYNDTAGEDSSTMRLGFWNDYVSININPMLPKSEQVDGKIYNYEKTASTVIGIDAVYQLYTGINILEREMKKEKETGKEKKINSVSVRGSDVILTVGCPGNYEGIDSYYLALFSLEKDGTVNGNAFYVFTNPSDGLMLNFNEDDGSYKNRSINTQWEEFKLFIKYSVENLINGSAHGVNKNLEYKFTKFENTLETIKALVENLLGGSNNTSSRNESSRNTGFSSGGSRRRRSSITLDDDEVEETDTSFNDVSEEYDDEEVPFEEVETTTTTKPKKTTSKKSSSTKKSTGVKKNSKKISVEDIAADMDDDLDDMSDLD